MKIRHPALIRGVGLAGSWMVRGLGSTLRYHFRPGNPSLMPEAARVTGQRFIYAFFHEIMLFPAYRWPWPEMNVLISDHSDGEIIAQLIRRLGFSVVRGSTTRNGARALREMTRRIDSGHICFTPDGPRGPRRTVQPGMIYASSRMGLPIVPVGMAFRRPWRAKSWDRFAVPRPFTPAACVFHEAVAVPAEAGRDELEHHRLDVERRMNRATEEAEAWVETL